MPEKLARLDLTALEEWELASLRRVIDIGWTDVNADLPKDIAGPILDEFDDIDTDISDARILKGIK